MMMKIIITLAIILGNSLALKAVDRYVSLHGTNDFASQFTDWHGAATDIQWAVNFALAGETVWVSNGTYYLTNQINIANGITLKASAAATLKPSSTATTSTASRSPTAVLT